MVAGPIGCGVLEHPEDCLCDVKLPAEPTPIRVRDAVGEMFMGPSVCELRGYSVPWTPNKMLDYFVDLCRFYDVWVNTQDAEDENQIRSLADVPRKLDLSREYTFRRYSTIRDTVKMCMDNLDVPLVHILQHIGVTADQFMEAVTSGKTPHLSFTYEDLTKLDRAMMTKSLSYTGIAREMGLTVMMVRGLIKYWRIRREKQPHEQTAKERMHDLAINSSKSAAEICDIIQQEYGVIYHRSAVSKVRIRS